MTPKQIAAEKKARTISEHSTQLPPGATGTEAPAVWAQRNAV